MNDAAENSFGDLSRLNAVRIFVVIIIAIGFASTMPLGPGNKEFLYHFGYDPSWFGIHVLFFLSGFLGFRTMQKHGSMKLYLSSRFWRNWPLFAVYTVAITTIIYPIFCDVDESAGESVAKLTTYLFKTLTLIDPGTTLPGLLDSAKYTCLIQGSIWTLRWGALSHLGFSLGWKLGLLNSRVKILIVAIIATFAYIAINYIATGSPSNVLAVAAAATRLGSIFIIGACTYAWRAYLPANGASQALMIAVFVIASSVCFYLVNWLQMTELLMSLFWSYVALIFIQNNSVMTHWMKHWPNIVFGIFLGAWPVSQIVVLTNPTLTGWPLIGIAISITVGLALITRALISARFETRAATSLAG